MPQTGLTSAVGTCVESAFRDTPVTVVSGTNYEPGIAGQAPLRFCSVEPGGGVPMKPEEVIPDNEIDGGIEPIRNMLLSKTYDGTHSFKCDGENLYNYLLAIFGKDIQTQVQTSNSTISTNMFQHVFTFGKYAPSLTLEEIFGDATYARLSGGTVVPKLTLDFSKELMAHVSLMPYRQIPNNYPNAAGAPTDYLFGSAPAIIPSQMSSVADGAKTWQRTATPIFVDVQQENGAVINANSIFVFAAMAYGTVGGTLAASFVTINNVAYAIELLEGFTIDLDRNITSTMVAGSGYDPGTTTGNQCTASGKMSAQFEDMALQLAAANGKKMAMNFKIPGIIPGTGVGNTQAYMLEVHIPNFRWLVPEGPTLPDGPILTGGTWKAKKDPTLGYAIKITLINTYDHTQLGGCYPLSSALSAPTAVATAVATFANASNIVANDVHTFTEPTVNGGVGVSKTVLSVNYATNVVTYTTNVGFIFPFATTVVTRNRVGGLGGWSNA